MIKVAWHRSLGAKLFFLVTVCLTGTVALISWQNGRLFGRFLDRQIKTHTVDEAREGATAIAGTLDGWRAQMSIAVHGVAGEPDAARRGAILRSFLAANRELAAIGIYEGKQALAFAVGGGGGGGKDLRYEDKSQEDVGEKLREGAASWVRQLGDDQSVSTLRVTNLLEVAKLPLLGLAVRFPGEANAAPLWAVLAAWQERLASSLPVGEQVRAALIDASGLPLVSVVPAGEETAAAAERTTLLRVSNKLGASPFGFKAFADQLGVPRSGAFARLARHDLMVVVSRDARPGYQAVRQIIFQTAIWAWVIFLCSIFLSYISVARVTRSLKRVTEATLKIAGGDFSTRLNPKSGDEVGALSHAVNHMSGRIVDLLKTTVAAARQEKELVTTKAVQDMLYPTDDIVDAGIAISGHCHVASECGGDWWGHFKTDDGRHFVLVVDVTGHGAPAAIVTAMAYSAQILLAEVYSDPLKHHGSVMGILSGMNRLLWSAGKGKVTATALAFLIDPATGEMTYASAGHTMPFLTPRRVDDPRIECTGGAKKRNSLLLRCQGTPLGFNPQLDLEENHGILEPGDRCYEAIPMIRSTPTSLRLS